MLTALFKKIRGKTVRQRRSRIAYLFLLPSLFFVLLHFVIPTIYNIVLSFSDWHIIRPLEFVGFENYLDVFTSDEFWESLGRTLYFTLLCVPTTVTLALIVALGLFRVGPRRGSAFRSRNVLCTSCSIFNGCCLYLDLDVQSCIWTT